LTDVGFPYSVDLGKTTVFALRAFSAVKDKHDTQGPSVSTRADDNKKTWPDKSHGKFPSHAHPNGQSVWIKMDKQRCFIQLEDMNAALRT
jgi:hypothetical protein